MSPDPFDDLRAELVRAATRQRTPRLRVVGRRRTAVLGLAVLAVGGTATAAVVTRTAEESAPLTATLPASPSVRGYAISIGPDLRAGAVGWCTVTRFTAGGRPTVTGSGCGGAAGAGSGFVAGGFATFGEGVLRQAIVTRRVAAVVFPGNRRVVPRADPRLPFGWRAAVLYQSRGRFDPSRPSFETYEGADGRPIPRPTAQAMFSRGVRSRKVTTARPAARCVIGATPGFRVVDARVAVGAPKVPELEDPAFASCGRTVLRAGEDRTRFDVAILRDAEDPAARAAPLPRTPGLSGRRLGPAWLVVAGGTAAERQRLLAGLDPRP